MNRKLLIGLLVAGIVLAIVVHFYNKARYAAHARTFIQQPSEADAPSLEQISHPQDGAKKQEIIESKKDHAHDQQLIKELTDKIKHSPQDPLFYYQRAIVNYGMQQNQSAIDDLTEVIKLAPDSANAYYLRGLNYAARMDYKNALIDYAAALNIKPNNPIILNSRALAEVETGDLQNAWEDYSLALRQQPDYDHAHYNLGTLYERQKKYPDAKSEYDLAIQYYKPDYIPAQPTPVDATVATPPAADTSMDLPSLADQKSDLLRLLNVYYRRAIVNYEMGDFNAALADASFVIEKNPTDVKAYKLRAEIYGKLGNTAAAAVDESKAQDLSISNMLQQ